MIEQRNPPRAPGNPMQNKLIVYQGGRSYIPGAPPRVVARKGVQKQPLPKVPFWAFVKNVYLLCLYLKGEIPNIREQIRNEITEAKKDIR
jgi:hypothetical protein